MPIPKIIHQTYSSLAALPPELHGNMAHLKALNPDWELRFYDDAAVEAFIAQHYDAKVLAIYQRINPDYGAVRADLFRYLLIYRTGGVYLDIKGSMDSPLDEVLAKNDRYLLSFWPKAEDPSLFWGGHPELFNHPLGEFQQWHLIAEAGHPFLRAVINNVLANIQRYRPSAHGVGRVGALRITGPLAYTLAIAPILHQAPHRLLANHRDLGLRYTVLNSHRSRLNLHYSTLNEPIVISPAKG